MYGMVHEALGQMVTRRANAEEWRRVCERAGVRSPTFISLSAYPDATTLALVTESAAALRLGVDELLVEFGRFWIEFALGTAYGPLLRDAGRTLRETLESLDAIHSRVGLALPDLKPPSFRVVSAPEGLVLHYYSTRSGLVPFVIGLVHALGEMHDTKVEVRHTRDKARGADHDELLITVAA